MRSGKRKKTHASVFDRFRARRRDGRTRSRKPKNAFKTDPSLVGVRLGSVSRLRQLITIGELSTELCLSCVRDITADARRTHHARYYASRFADAREHLRLTRFKVLSSQTSDGTDNDFLIIGVRACRRQNRNRDWRALFSEVFDLSSGDSGLARARCGPFTGSCGRIRALRATWRESVARVTL